MPKGVLVGLLCQYSIMPVVGFTLATLFGFPPEIAAGSYFNRIISQRAGFKCNDLPGQGKPGIIGYAYCSIYSAGSAHHSVVDGVICRPVCTY